MKEREKDTFGTRCCSIEKAQIIVINAFIVYNLLCV